MEADQRDVVVVTGSSGYIGSAVVRRLAERYRVVGFDRAVSRQPPPVAECICVDVTSDSSVAAGMARLQTAYGNRIASVIHLAGYFDLTGKPNPQYEAVTVRGTERLLRALQVLDLQQFVFVSSMLVQAPTQPGVPIDEDSPLDATPLPYRDSKIRAEQRIREQHGAIPVVLLRPAGIYDDMGHSAFLAQQIARIYERQLLGHVYPGPLHTGQPLLHLQDLVEAMLRIVERRAELPTELPLLLAESEAIGVAEMQSLLGQRIRGENWETRRIPKALAKLGARMQDDVLDEEAFIRPWMVDAAGDHYEVDTARAQQLLGWRPAHALRESLPRIVAALLADPVGWYRANKLNAARIATLAVTATSTGQQGKQNGRQETSMQATGMNDRNAPDNAAGKNPMHGTTQGAAGSMGGHAASMRKLHFDTLWAHYVNILLGAWLLASPFAFGGLDAGESSAAVMRVTAERGLADPALRTLLLARSDVISGLLIMLFGTLSLSPRFSWAQWANTLVGVWLLFAPLLFWTPSAAVYANDTLVGALVIAFAVLVPMMPGMAMAGMMDATDLPAGWSYSPSTYLQRIPIIGLGVIGLLLSRHMAAYQLGHVNGAWEPFFSATGGQNGTEAIITSNVSKAWPIADAGLGAVTYVFEILMGAMGDRRRWRTMPWMVAMFCAVVVPLGVVSITFIIIQPIVLGTWCTLCLITALAMLVMIPFALDELVATGQYLVQNQRRGGAFWRTFFQGGAQPSGGNDDQPGFDATLANAARSAARGVTVPWTLLASALLGVWLMFTRLAFDTQPPLADSDHLVGALIVTVAVIAMAEVARPLRFLNVAFGLWLMVAPWVLAGSGSFAASSSGAVVGLLVAALSLRRGKRSREHYGSWDRFVV